MFRHLMKRGVAILCLAAVLALPAYAEGRITTDMTMKEIRSDPAIAGSGISTYIKGDADDLALRRRYENKTLADYIGKATAQDSADGLNLAIETYVEVKLDKSAQEAIAQIREKGYAEKYRASGKRITLIGMNFSSEARQIGDVLVEEA